ncbi:hypothetical protein Hypma_002740 [Hypsizygus marmoreus]|uniref:DUF6699 domain-containing protein n=1 Tax=Hypsizygus marmoreus TaxID=39966 RepID=A0A369J5Y6_HYPMA|nr:hypothetical protein Hypma_002740 [Hypsizygus marmoreus]
MATSPRVLDTSTVHDPVLVSPSDPPDNGDMESRLEIEIRKTTLESDSRGPQIMNSLFTGEIPGTMDPSIIKSNVAIQSLNPFLVSKSKRLKSECRLPRYYATRITGEFERERSRSNKALQRGKQGQLPRRRDAEWYVPPIAYVIFLPNYGLATDSTSATAIGLLSATSDAGEIPGGSRDSSLNLSASDSIEPVDFSYNSQDVGILMNNDALNGQPYHLKDTSIYERAFLGMPPGATSLSSLGYLPSVNPSAVPVEGYVAGNPLHSSVMPAGDDLLPSNIRPVPLGGGSSIRTAFSSKSIRNTLAIKVDNGLRLAYHWMFLQIPMFYFTRVTRIFKEVRLNTDDLTKKVIHALVNQQKQETPGQQRLGARAYFIDVDDPQVSILKTLWADFIDSLMREWKTLNIVSVLLMSAIIGTLQINVAFSDPLVRMSVFASLICALMSLIYGGMFIIRFSNMRRLHKAIEWAKAGESTSTAIFWNVWVLLAMPAIWLSWSLILYVIGIMSFIWRASSNGEAPTKISPRTELGVRILISCILLLGVVYLVLIIHTLKCYGEQMDDAWKEKVRNEVPNYNTTFTDTPRSRVQEILPVQAVIAPSIDDGIELQPPFSVTHFGHLDRPPHSKFVFDQAVEVLRFTSSGPRGSPMPQSLVNRGLNLTTWSGFIENATLAWIGSSNEQSDTGPRRDVLRIITTWNTALFNRCRFQAHLCRIYPIQAPQSPLFTIYLTDLNIHAPFRQVPTGVQRIEIFDSHAMSSAFSSMSSAFAPGYHPENTQDQSEGEPLDSNPDPPFVDSSIVGINSQPDDASGPQPSQRFRRLDGLDDAPPFMQRENVIPDNHEKELIGMSSSHTLGPVASTSLSRSTSDQPYEPPAPLETQTALKAIRPTTDFYTAQSHAPPALVDTQTVPEAIQPATDFHAAQSATNEIDSGSADQAVTMVDVSATQVFSDSKPSMERSGVRFSAVNSSSDEGRGHKQPRHREIRNPPAAILKTRTSLFVLDTIVEAERRSRFTVLTLHPVLQYQKHKPRGLLDLRIPPHYPFPEGELGMEPATTLGTRQMHLWSPLLQWDIYISQDFEHSVVTLEGVFQQLYDQLQIPVTETQFMFFSSFERTKIALAFKARCQLASDPELETRRGVRRIDVAGDNVIFEGLVEARNYTWEIKLGKYRGGVESSPGGDELNRGQE